MFEFRQVVMHVTVAIILFSYLGICMTRFWRFHRRKMRRKWRRVNCALRAGDEHYSRRRPGGCVGSQFSFETNSLGVRCLVYREDNVTKTNRGGLRDMKKERKIVWIKPSSNVNRCPVRIVEKYMKLLPQSGSKPNLYLHSLKYPKPSQWYCETQLGINKVRSVVSTMIKNAR